MTNGSNPASRTLPTLAHIADGLALLLAVAALRVAVFGGIRIGTAFSMSTPWRALAALAVICALRHYFVREAPLHERIWAWLRAAARRLQALPTRWVGVPVRLGALPALARVADGLTVLLAVAVTWVGVLGGIRIGTVFSMSTPWRALVALTIICALRHHLVREAPLHERLWAWSCAAAHRLEVLADRAAPAVSPALRGGHRVVDTYRRITHMTVARALQTLGLNALAVAQPLFDVVSREPAFFVARNTTLGQLVALVAALTVLLPLMLIGVEAFFQRLHPVAGAVVHVVLLTALGSLMLLPVLKRVDGLDTVPLVMVALVLAGVVALASQRMAVVSMFLAALGPATVLVPALFLANPDIRGALVPVEVDAVSARVETTPPIVFIVFDEFPTTSLLNHRREIDRERYPHFARLADDAMWFRNASTVSSQTLWAVPAITTGRYPVEPNAVPTRRYYPNSLFTMLGESYEMTVFGRFLQMCPADTCVYDLEVRDALGPLIADMAVVYLHIVAPDALSARLPPIVGDWRGFAQRRMSREVDGARRLNERSSEYDRFLQTITPERSGRLYFLHTLTPHMPFEYVPSGARYVAPDYQAHEENGEGLFLKSDPWLPVVLQQRHFLQVGFVDSFVGNLLDRLQEQGIYDESLIVVTADHGSSFLHGRLRRNGRYGNHADIMLVPLIVKLPGQRMGVVTDRNVETVDIVPTIAEVLGASVPYAIDGRSLLDVSAPERPSKTFIRRNLERVLVDEFPLQMEDHSLEQTLLHFGTGLYGVGPGASWVGRSIAEIDAAAEEISVAAKLNNPSMFENVNVDAGTLPLYVRGTVEGDVQERVSLAVSVNGVIVATTVSYVERGAWVFASMIPEGALTAGANAVEILVLGGVGEGESREADAVGGEGTR